MKLSTVPVMANQLPWNELVLQGRRTFKTISFNWQHRGKILLYNSTTIDQDGCLSYDISLEDAKKLPRMAIVGIATVTDVYDDGDCFVVELVDPKRFKKPIPFKPKQGCVRVFRAPARFLRRAII